MRMPRGHMDFESGVGEFETAGGELMRAQMPASLREASTNIRRMTVDVEADELVLVLPGGVEAHVELGVTGDRAADPLAGRRIVYLDQNRWSAMAAWRHGHRRIDASEAAAAERLAELVTAREIVLPMSAGHLVETAPLYDDPREALASTVLEYSRGWQWRNPVDVRREEIAAALGGATPVAAGVASLGADVLFTQRLQPVDGSDLPRLMASALPRLVNVSSVYDVIVDRDPVPDQGGRAAAERWAQKHADLANALADAGASREQVRSAAHGAVLADLAEEIEALAPIEQVTGWFARADADVAAMPFLSRYRAVIFARLRAGGTWLGNDLNDLIYLCCAAGYADVVVGENRTIGDLRTARGVPDGATLATTLAEAVAILEPNA
jgi:hypothetical protein